MYIFPAEIDSGCVYNNMFRPLLYKSTRMMCVLTWIKPTSENMSEKCQQELRTWWIKLWKRVNEMDADNTLVKSGKVTSMSRSPTNPAQAKKVVLESSQPLSPVLSVEERCTMGQAAFWADESSSFLPTHDKDGIVQHCVCVHSNADSSQTQPTMCAFLCVLLCFYYCECSCVSYYPHANVF